MKLHKEPGYLYDEGLAYLVVFILVIFALIYFWYIFLVLGLVAFLAFGFKIIPPGRKGIILWFGKRSNEVFDEGLAWNLPLFSTLEIIDCRIRFIEERDITVLLAYLINVNLKTSISYQVDNPSNYLDNYSISDLDGKIKTYVTNSLKLYLTKNEVTEQEILKMDTSEYFSTQIEAINNGYLSNFGLKITDIALVIIEINTEMKTFFEVLRQADIMHKDKKLSYNIALEKALLINGKIDQNNFNLMVKGLSQLRRIQALA